jgi:hypothetical protein
LLHSGPLRGAARDLHLDLADLIARNPEPQRNQCRSGLRGIRVLLVNRADESNLSGSTSLMNNR